MTPNIVYSREICREGNAAAEQGDLEVAEKKLERAILLNPKEADIRKHYAEILWQRDKQKESIEQLIQATKLSRNEGAEDPMLSISLAEKLYLSGNMEEANRRADWAIHLNSKDFKAWALHGKIQSALGNSQIQFGKPDRAVQYLQNAASDYYRALAMSEPGSVQTREILAELALVQAHLNQPQRALATWQNLERLYQPDSPPIKCITGKAETLLALDRAEDAMELYRQATEIAPNEPAHYVRLAELQMKYKQFDDVQNTIQSLSQHSPNHPAIAQLADEMKHALVLQSGRYTEAGMGDRLHPQ